MKKIEERYVIEFKRGEEKIIVEEREEKSKYLSIEYQVKDKRKKVVEAPEPREFYGREIDSIDIVNVVFLACAPVFVEASLLRKSEKYFLLEEVKIWQKWKDIVELSRLAEKKEGFSERNLDCLLEAKYQVLADFFFMLFSSYGDFEAERKQQDLDELKVRETSSLKRGKDNFVISFETILRGVYGEIKVREYWILSGIGFVPAFAEVYYQGKVIFYLDAEDILLFHCLFLDSSKSGFPEIISHEEVPIGNIEGERKLNYNFWYVALILNYLSEKKKEPRFLFFFQRRMGLVYKARLIQELDKAEKRFLYTESFLDKLALSELIKVLKILNLEGGSIKCDNSYLGYLAFYLSSGRKSKYPEIEVSLFLKESPGEYLFVIERKGKRKGKRLEFHFSIENVSVYTETNSNVLFTPNCIIDFLFN